MALKPVYVIDGRRWLPITRAAELLATNAATIRAMIADGRLGWRQLRANSATLLVDHADVLHQRAARGTARTEVARRAAAVTRTARERGVSQRDRDVVEASARFGIFDATWDPAPVARPPAGRDD